MALNIVAHPYQYFGDPDVGRPIAGGDVYIGIVDLDPTIVANQKSVTLRQEDGTEVSVSQPISLSAGGYPSYQGSPVSILVDGDYSIAVLDSIGVQKFYSSSSPAGFILTSENSVTVVDNVAALVASSPAPGDVYDTRYYSTRANGGDGRYLVKTAAQATADGDTVDEIGAGFTLANGNVAILQHGTELKAEWWGVIPDGPTFFDTEMDAQIAYWLGLPEGERGTIVYPAGFIKRRTTYSLPGNLTIVGMLKGTGQTFIDFDYDGLVTPPKNMVELMSVRELDIEDIWFRYVGTDASKFPEVGFLEARASDGGGGDIFSGRHRYHNMRCTGFFTIAAYYNYASEELYYSNCQFRNFNNSTVSGIDALETGIGAAAIITAVNDVYGVTSETDTIITYKQSTTVFNMDNCKFDQSGFDSTTSTFVVAGATGLSLDGGYIQSNGLSAILLDSSNGACGNIVINATQLEQSNKDVGNPNFKNHDYSAVLLANTSGTPYAASSHGGIKFKGIAEFGTKSLLLDTVRTLQDSEFEMSRVVESSYTGTTDTVVDSCVFNCPEGVDLTATKTLTNVSITCDAWSTIVIPTIRHNGLKLIAKDAPPFYGDTEDTRSSVSGTLTVVYNRVRLGNPTTPVTEILLGSGSPIHGQEVYLCSNTSASMTIVNNDPAGNIFCTGNVDLTPNRWEFVKLIYNSKEGKWIASIH